jgi:hypothetical protein
MIERAALRGHRAERAAARITRRVTDVALDEPAPSERERLHDTRRAVVAHVRERRVLERAHLRRVAEEPAGLTSRRRPAYGPERRRLPARSQPDVSGIKSGRRDAKRGSLGSRNGPMSGTARGRERNHGRRERIPRDARSGASFSRDCRAQRAAGRSHSPIATASPPAPSPAAPARRSCPWATWAASPRTRTGAGSCSSPSCPCTRRRSRRRPRRRPPCGR